jgi:hypothetical protein
VVRIIKAIQDDEHRRIKVVGLAAARIIKAIKDDEQRRIKVVGLTAVRIIKSDPGRRAEAYQSGRTHER